MNKNKTGTVVVDSQTLTVSPTDEVNMVLAFKRDSFSHVFNSCTEVTDITAFKCYSVSNNFLGGAEATGVGITEEGTTEFAQNGSLSNLVWGGAIKEPASDIGQEMGMGRGKLRKVLGILAADANVQEVLEKVLPGNKLAYAMRHMEDVDGFADIVGEEITETNRRRIAGLRKLK